MFLELLNDHSWANALSAILIWALTPFSVPPVIETMLPNIHPFYFLLFNVKTSCKPFILIFLVFSIFTLKPILWLSSDSVLSYSTMPLYLFESKQVSSTKLMPSNRLLIPSVPLGTSFIFFIAPTITIRNTNSASRHPCFTPLLTSKALLSQHLLKTAGEIFIAFMITISWGIMKVLTAFHIDYLFMLSNAFSKL